MPKVLFEQVKIEYAAIQAVVQSEIFHQLILQPVTYDAEGRKDRYELIIYAMSDNNGVIGEFKTEVYSKTPTEANSKLGFGNIPVSEYQLKDVLQPKENDVLYFKPYLHGGYACYKLGLGMEKELTDLDLKPSPPAPPPPESREMADLQGKTSSEQLTNGQAKA